MSMIVPGIYNVFALLADGRFCLWEITGKPVIEITGIEAKAIARRYHNTRTLFILTHDNRFLVSNIPNDTWNTKRFMNGLQDITALVCEAMEIKDRASHTFDICVDNSILVVRAEYSVGMFEPADIDGSQYSTKIVYRFQDQIDLSGFGYRFGLVRTGNKLYFVGTCNTHTSYHPYTDRVLYVDTCENMCTEIDFLDVQGIGKIICFMRFVLLLMNDGRVYHSSLPEGPGDPHPCSAFEQVVFPSNECIIKIVSNESGAIYITQEGTCYYGVNNMRCLKPILLCSLTGLFVTDAFMLNNYIMIQYGNDRLCLLPLIQSIGRPYYSGYLDHGYVTGSKKPINILGCNECITSVTSVDSPNYYSMTYFTTTDGRVYQRNDGDSDDYDHTCSKSEPVSIQFFDDNPVACVRDPAARIASAQSNPKHDD